MKKYLFLIATLVFAQDLINQYNPEYSYYYYKEQNPFLYIEENNQTDEENKKSIEEFSSFDESNTTYDELFDFEEKKVEKNNTITIPEDKNISLSEKNISEIINNNLINEENITSLIENEKKIKIAIIINKKFSSIIAPVMNSLNAYLSNKNIEYSIEIVDEKNKEEVNASNIIYITPTYKEINTTKGVFYPLLRKESNKTNEMFGGIDYKKQLDILLETLQQTQVEESIDELNITTKNSQVFSIIKDNTLYSKKLLNLEKKFTKKIYYYRWINYKDINNTNIIFNTDATKTAQVLSNITAKDINISSALSTQINYNPLIIELTQPQDIKKLIIANSLSYYPLYINEYASLLSTNIRYNWLNYAICAYANYILNEHKELNETNYLKDFNIYIINNKIEYNTKLYKIEKGAFKEAE